MKKGKELLILLRVLRERKVSKDQVSIFCDVTNHYLRRLVKRSAEICEICGRSKDKDPILNLRMGRTIF